MVLEGGLRMKGHKWNQNYDLQVISFFNLGPRSSKFQKISICHWNPPAIGVIMFCCDGPSIGNIGEAGFGVVVRDHLCQVLGTLTGGIGIATNYVVEVYALICAAELAVQWNMHHIILKYDSKTVITEFAQGQVPWFVRTRWVKAASKIGSIIFCHSYREANFSADATAKRGAKLQDEERQIFKGRPSHPARIEMPGVNYYRFN
ncbi:uncharacterized protein LOC113359052 [Papaver somniferum]|uniref:uncharacterized protein LOC113359052 n=1 Tax=Papaver somniferum TaxID=3469 RepID=UPI000E6FABFD|nr:uncharacterized protein LOC113359052 [Papaver somniferum]